MALHWRCELDEKADYIPSIDVLNVALKPVLTIDPSDRNCVSKMFCEEVKILPLRKNIACHSQPVKVDIDGSFTLAPSIERRTSKLLWVQNSIMTTWTLYCRIEYHDTIDNVFVKYTVLYVQPLEGTLKPKFRWENTLLQRKHWKNDGQLDQWKEMFIIWVRLQI